MPAEFPGLRQNNRKSWEVWVLPWTPGSKVWQHHICFPHQRKCPSPLLGWCEQHLSKLKNHQCAEIQSTQIKPVRWQVAVHCWTSQHRHTNPLNHSPTEGKLPTLRSACSGGNLKSLKNGSGWRIAPKAMVSSSTKCPIPAYQLSKDRRYWLY